jgi:signal peptidase I
MIWKTFRIIEFCIILLIGSFVSYFAVKNYGISLGTVKGCSMEPTYHDLDKIIINKFSLLWRNPVKGEVVLVWQPTLDNGYDIKRIAAVPGDLIQTSNDKQYLLGNSQYFVVGDNLDKSYDSRYYGPVHRVQIVGVVK